MKATATKLNAKIDNLEKAFETNRIAMENLIEQNKRCTTQYDELLAANNAINDEIRTLLEQLWKLN